MRKTIVSLLAVSLAVTMLTLAGRSSGSEDVEALQRQVTTLTAERDSLRAQLEASKERVAELESTATIHRELLAQTDADVPASVEAETRSIPKPEVTTDARGKKSYFFPELIGAEGQVIARSAQFRELLGYDKLSFRTSEGIRYYDLDDVHPEVVRALGYDAAILKRRLADAFRHRQALGAQARFQQELRAKAAMEQVEREKAAAETLQAEAAIRDAAARERLAEAAERAATAPPPPPRVTKNIIVVPYGYVQPKDPEPPEPETP